MSLRHIYTFFFAYFEMFFILLLDRTGTLTVALLAGDIGQSGLVPGQETQNILQLKKKT